MKTVVYFEAMLRGRLARGQCPKSFQNIKKDRTIAWEFNANDVKQKNNGLFSRKPFDAVTRFFCQ